MTEAMPGNTLTGRQQSSMSFWSRHDPVMVPHNTDHWAKLRVRSSYLADLGDPTVFKPTNRVSVGVVECRKDPGKLDFQTRMRQLQENGDGRVDPKGASVFTKVVSRDLHGNIPDLAADETHLEIQRSDDWKAMNSANYNIIKARRPTSSLMGAGLHGLNLWNCYVLPELLYGLRVIPLKDTHKDSMDAYHGLD
ncbi:hypothetical protein LSH36_994g00023 [Paralvinella palmiformis]|uniref:Uncharacterized protein n=1 Tax=Paralvinella palmiformis TaxID=53620 RepID=A0AAD9IXI9_9ANNE|nr:hypothetical protein LSH36_994g00023 [Paralvinella palmiformis]